MENKINKAQGHIREEKMNAGHLVLVLGLAAFIVLADNWVVSPIIPAIAESFNIRPASAGMLIAAYMLPFGLFQLIYGPLADRFGKLKVITISLALFTVASALCGLAMDLNNLGMYRALTGIFAAAVTPVSLALIADIVPLEKRQAAIGTFLGIGLLGQSLSMGIGGMIAQYVSWRGVFFVYAMVSAIVTALVIVVSRSIPGQFRKRTEGRYIMPYIGLLGNPVSLKAYLLIFLEGFIILGAFSYLGAHISNEFRMDYLSIGLIMSLFGISSLIAGKAAGKIAPLTGGKRLIGIGLFIGSIALLLVSMFSNNLILTTFGIFVLGFGTMLAHSTLITLATEFAQKARGVAMSLVAFSIMTGGALGTTVGGALIENFNYKSFFLIFGVTLLFVSIIVPVIISEPKARDERDGLVVETPQ